MGDWKDILLDNEEPLSEEDLLKHINELKSGEELKEIAKDPFESDAIEGLKQIESTDKVKQHVKGLNKKLQSQLLSKKSRGEKMKSFGLRWIILTLLIILFICIMGYFLIKLNSI